jgi:hypothetical protein
MRTAATILAVTGAVVAFSGPSIAAASQPAIPRTGTTGRESPVATFAGRVQWLITARAGHRHTTDRIAAKCQAHRLKTVDYVGPQYQATGSRRRNCVMRRLKRLDLFVHVERNTSAGGTQVITPDPLDPVAAWRPQVINPDLPPPPVMGSSPLLAIVDDPLDTTHPELAGGRISTLSQLPPRSSHGLATAAIAGAPKNDVGIIGVWPGMRVLNIPLPSADYLCSDRVEAIAAAIRARSTVISLEYGAPSRCFAEAVMVQLAIGQGIVVVAGVGNTFAEGNAREYPGYLPHVVTVGAVGPDLQHAPFSTANTAIDLSAPGVNVLTAVRRGDAGDPDGDGYAPVSGTSFAAAMVGAGAAWVQAARPRLARSEVTYALLVSGRKDPRGWDIYTGYGVLDVAAAVGLPDPLYDPTEPNDDIEWIDGTIFLRPDPSVGARNRNQAFVALADKNEDPADVYRVVVRAHRRARVTVTPLFGDIDVAAYGPRARRIGDRRRRIGRSHRHGTRAERVMITNRESRARTYFVAVTPRTLNSRYVLSLRRRPSRVRAAHRRSGPDLAEAKVLAPRASTRG